MFQRSNLQWAHIIPLPLAKRLILPLVKCRATFPPVARNQLCGCSPPLAPASKEGEMETINKERTVVELLIESWVKISRKNWHALTAMNHGKISHALFSGTQFPATGGPWMMV